MKVQQFIILAIFTAFETYFFNSAMMSGNYLMAIFWAFLIGRNLLISYAVSKFVNDVEDYLKKKK